MDPITAAFVSYIELAGQYSARKLFIDPLDLEISTISVEHEGVEVSFSHQLWRIKHKSVCLSYRQDAAQFSKCSVSASSLFKAMCKQTRSSSALGRNKKHIKNMYCNAALSYEPTIADVQWSETRNELAVARRECNTAMAVALGSKDNKLINDRKMKCSKYNELKRNHGK